MVIARSPRPRATTALLIAALAATLLAAAPAPVAVAAVIASSVSGFEGGPALASDGRVVVGERRGNGALRIVAIDPRTRVATQLAAFPPLPDRRTYSELHVTGTGGIVTAVLDTLRQVGATDAEQPQPTRLATRAMTILPAVAPLGSCISSSFSSDLDAAGGEGFVASVDEDCGAGPEAVRLRTANGTITIPAQTGPADRLFAPQISSLRASGPMVAWVEAHLTTVGSQVTATLVIARGATGEVLLRLDGLGSRGLGSDGTVTQTSPVSCKMGVVSPAAPALRTFELPAGLCPFGDALVAGGRIVYQTSTGYAVSDLQGAAHPLGEARMPRAIGSPFAFDGRTAFVVNADCDADRLLAVDAGVAGEPLPPPPTTLDTCPVRRSGPSRLRIAPDGRVSIGLRCPAGCRGTLRLVQQRRSRRERLVGRADYVGGAGAVVVAPRIARFARALAGCAGGLRVAALAHPVDGDHSSVSAGRGKGLGAYRIVSRARCRRSGGPAFTRPRPGPRP